jgi:transposase
LDRRASLQVCWAHLRRDSQAMIDRGGAAEPIGRRLFRLPDRLFRWWLRIAADEVDRGQFRTAKARLRREVRSALGDGVRGGCGSTRGACSDILRLEESLWTFTRVGWVPPENNGAERAERYAVIWRRISGGTDSARGRRFVERMPAVPATCRQQGRDVLHYLTSCFEAAGIGQAIPFLMPAMPPKVVAA